MMGLSEGKRKQNKSFPRLCSVSHVSGINVLKKSAKVVEHHTSLWTLLVVVRLLAAGRTHSSESQQAQHSAQL